MSSLDIRDKFINLDLISKTTTLKFYEFTRYICTRNVLNITSQYIINLKLNLKVQELLSSFILVYYTSDILSIELNDLEKELIKISKKFIESLYKFPVDTEYIYNISVNYQNIFVLWKKIDQEDLIKLVDLSYNQTNTVSHLIDEKIINNTKKQLEKISTIIDSNTFKNIKLQNNNLMDNDINTD